MSPLFVIGNLLDERAGYPQTASVKFRIATSPTLFEMDRMPVRGRLSRAVSSPSRHALLAGLQSLCA